jgi:probable rRNA maturation factor
MVDTEFLGKVASMALDDNLASRKNKEISIAMVDIKRMAKLNEKFRGVKEPTDVLAFPLGGEFISTENLLGEVVISVDKAEEQARERGHSLENELALLTVHGVLHLLGYTDEDEDKKKIMQDKEKKILHFFRIELSSERREINEREE